MAGVGGVSVPWRQVEEAAQEGRLSKADRGALNMLRHRCGVHGNGNGGQGVADAGFKGALVAPLHSLPSLSQPRPLRSPFAAVAATTFHTHPRHVTEASLEFPRLFAFLLLADAVPEMWRGGVVRVPVVGEVGSPAWDALVLDGLQHASGSQRWLSRWSPAPLPSVPVCDRAARVADAGPSASDVPFTCSFPLDDRDARAESTGTLSALLLSFLDSACLFPPTLATALATHADNPTSFATLLLALGAEREREGLGPNASGTFRPSQGMVLNEIGSRLAASLTQCVERYGGPAVVVGGWGGEREAEAERQRQGGAAVAGADFFFDEHGHLVERNASTGNWRVVPADEVAAREAELARAQPPAATAGWAWDGTSGSTTRTAELAGSRRGHAHPAEEGATADTAGRRASRLTALAAAHAPPTPPTVAPPSPVVDSLTAPTPQPRHSLTTTVVCPAWGCAKTQAEAEAERARREAEEAQREAGGAQGGGHVGTVGRGSRPSGASLPHAAGGGARAGGRVSVSKWKAAHGVTPPPTTPPTPRPTPQPTHHVAGGGVGVHEDKVSTIGDVEQGTAGAAPAGERDAIAAVLARAEEGKAALRAECERRCDAALGKGSKSSKGLDSRASRERDSCIAACQAHSLTERAGAHDGRGVRQRERDEMLAAQRDEEGGGGGVRTVTYNGPIVRGGAAHKAPLQAKK